VSKSLDVQIATEYTKILMKRIKNLTTGKIKFVDWPVVERTPALTDVLYTGQLIELIENYLYVYSFSFISGLSFGMK